MTRCVKALAFVHHHLRAMARAKFSTAMERYIIIIILMVIIIMVLPD